ncbi:MAG: hypothetical protein GY935_24970 [Gammaproteobacteria bacterium]|nr:hypothetical protein [Gammaproteobacteria bacterium]
MNVSRPKTVTIQGGSFIAATDLGATVFVTIRTPRKTLAPWRMLDSFSMIIEMKDRSRSQHRQHDPPFRMQTES